MMNCQQQGPGKLGTALKTMESKKEKTRAILKDESYKDTRIQDETKYVDLDHSLNFNTGGTTSGKMSSTAEGSQVAVHKSSGAVTDPGMRNNADLTKTVSECKGDVDVKEWIENDPKGSLKPALSKDCLKSQGGPAGKPEVRTQPLSEILPKKEDATDMPTSIDNGDLEYTDEYLSRTSDSDDDVSLVLSDECVPDATEDESHYITTHEIQLSELSDHEVDYDAGVGSHWDIENDNQVYSFVDYASLDSETRERGERTESKQASQSNSGAAVSSLLESDLCGKAKCATSDEHNGNSEGQIHLSIKTTSRAINEPSNIQEKEKILYHAKRAGDMSHYVFTRADAKADKLCDSAKCFIAAPGRLHFGRKLKGKDVNDHSSGTSSAVSELDDADKEVRNLTARTFKSLAYPYFDAINFSTSSESSASEHGLGINRWSTFVDLKYGNVNVSQGREQKMLSHKSSTSSFEIAKNKDNKGYRGLTNMKPPPSNIFNLNGNPHNASSSTKKIELMGKFGQRHSGVITLTETLNFRCNVKSGVSGERRSKFAQNAVGSRSSDEVTNTLPSGQGSAASKPPCNAGETMEDTHKKAIFASSLLKNVISKKIQFEQERKMERGEISEPPCQVPSPSIHQEPETLRENPTSRETRDLLRQNSKYSEASSDTIVCVDDLGDIVDNSSGDARSDRRRQDPLTHASETNLESTNEAGFDTKQGAFEAAKSTLLRSQNSAFRSWRDGELEFQKERKNDKTPEWKRPSTEDNLEETDLYADSGNSKLTKMSHLFVPSIQLLSSESEIEKQLQTMNYSTHASTDQGEGGDMALRSDSTLYVADSTRSVVTSKSPEIKINLRRLQDNKTVPFNISKLPVPNKGCNTSNMKKAADDSRCQALAAALKGESSDKIPHFMVRDIRDNKGKLQTPIHQVRDVRKLVKSSYHFVSLDNNDIKSSAIDLHPEPRILKQGPQRNPASLSPIVIKCQSVNTNSNLRESGNLTEVSKRRLSEDTYEIDRSSPEGIKTGPALVHRPSGRVPLVNKRRDSLEGPIGLRIETRTASRRQEKTPDTSEKKPESKNMAALEKLQAAVKTMEQLYVFDRNEWKRKSEPHPITDSHVLSMITSEEHGVPEEEEGDAAGATVPPSNPDKPTRRDSYPSADKTPPAGTASLAGETTFKREEKELPKTCHVPTGHEERNGPKWSPQHGGSGAGGKNMFSLGTGHKASVSTSSSVNANETQPHAASQAPYGSKGFCPKSPKVPVSRRAQQARPPAEEAERADGGEAGRPAAQTQSGNSAESENYLTIPVKSRGASAKPSARSGREKASLNPAGAKTQTCATPPEHAAAATARQEESRQSPKHSTVVMETRSQDTPTAATIYHHSLPMMMSPGQPQMICFSPTMAPSPAMDPFQATQRKMLLDPTTGNYYLVDTPVQPATKRLFDPETGQYVDVPMPQSPMASMPMPISPLALSPGAYGHTYMIYPGYMPAMMPGRTMQSQMSVQSEAADDGDKGGHPQHGESVYMESPYYVATGKSPQAQHLASGRAAQGLANVQQPVISITTQQGPRIIAPPSFDGTTMSFVLEHR